MSNQQAVRQLTINCLIMLVFLAMLGVGWLHYRAAELGVPLIPRRPVDQVELGSGAPRPEAPPEKILDFSDIGLAEAVAKGGAEGARAAAEAVTKAAEVVGDVAAEGVGKIPEAMEEAEKKKKPPK